MGRKFKYSAQDRDFALTIFFWRNKNLPVGSELKPPLIKVAKSQKIFSYFVHLQTNKTFIYRVAKVDFLQGRQTQWQTHHRHDTAANSTLCFMKSRQDSCFVSLTSCGGGPDPDSSNFNVSSFS